MTSYKTHNSKLINVSMFNFVFEYTNDTGTQVYKVSMKVKILHHYSLHSEHTYMGSVNDPLNIVFSLLSITSVLVNFLLPVNDVASTFPEAAFSLIFSCRFFFRFYLESVLQIYWCEIIVSLFDLSRFFIFIFISIIHIEWRNWILYNYRQISLIVSPTLQLQRSNLMLYNTLVDRGCPQNCSNSWTRGK